MCFTRITIIFSCEYFFFFPGLLFVRSDARATFTSSTGSDVSHSSCKSPPFPRTKTLLASERNDSTGARRWPRGFWHVVFANFNSGGGGGGGPCPRTILLLFFYYYHNRVAPKYNIIFVYDNNIINVIPRPVRTETVFVSTSRGTIVGYTETSRTSIFYNMTMTTTILSPFLLFYFVIGLFLFFFRFSTVTAPRAATTRASSFSRRSLSTRRLQLQSAAAAVIYTWIRAMSIAGAAV